MKTGKVLVDQIAKNGEIIKGYDQSLSSKEIYSVINSNFPNISQKDFEIKVICGEIEGKRYAIRCKNITYLGIPHPAMKKRIQIPEDLQLFYRIACSNGMTPILLGVYTFQDTLVFCDFDLKTYIEKKAHNSSAHIYSTDISNAVLNGIYSKQDYFKNSITAFDSKHVNEFLKNKLQIKVSDYRLEIVKVMDLFFDNLPRKWSGIECYQEMINCQYRNKFQPEWPGFYLEFCLEKFISNSKVKIIEYAQDKSKGGIDLDLYFPTIDSYGDLKAHSNHSGGIQGNDWNTVNNIINDVTKERSVYYIVLEHLTRKDKDFQFRVTEYWNRVQGKENLHSYGNRMKYDVELKRYYILDINRFNQMYLKEFHQGKNSDGKPRNTKIMIGKKEIPLFLIHSKEFT